MSPKKITVAGVGGVKLSSDAELEKWLIKRGVQSLVDNDGDEVGGFDTLEQDGKYAPYKKQRVTTKIERTDLLSPMDIVPLKESDPIFVCPDNWLGKVKTEIIWGLQSRDDSTVETNGNNDTLERVPPMGLVRCSRGGKTRALCEIANIMKDDEILGPDAYGEHVLASIYVSFNDTTSIEEWEQENPTQALLRRIAFAALSPTATEFFDPAIAISRSDRFREFMAKRPEWEEESFLKWMQHTPCVLLIDELNNLERLTKRNSQEAAIFGLFLKREFIGKKNRYLVFSSHLLGTFNFFSQYVDSSKGSSRPITLQELPIVASVDEARSLKKTLDSVREAMYYGLVPGMIYESAIKGKNIAGKRRYWVKEAIKNHSQELDACFCSILKSLIDGYLDPKFPEELGILLDSVQGKVGDLDKIRWVPYHLQFVLHEFGGTNFAHSRLASHLSDHCNLMKDAKELSGEGWEGLFVLFLVARCITRKSDNIFIPESWFKTSEEEVEVVLNMYDSYKNNGLLFGQCTTWDKMKPGVIPGCKSLCLNILYPTHNNFAVYDVIVVLFVGGKRQDVWGYQLKEGNAPRTQKAHPDMNGSLFVEGKPPEMANKDDLKGWTIPSKDEIDIFFGESGRHWTPESWRNFMNSSEKMRERPS